MKESPLLCSGWNSMASSGDAEMDDMLWRSAGKSCFEVVNLQWNELRRWSHSILESLCVTPTPLTRALAILIEMRESSFCPKSGWGFGV